MLGLLRDMAQDGQADVLMISHKFREVMKFADEVTVLRRGRLVGGGQVADLTPDAMARMMVGDGAAARPTGSATIARARRRRAGDRRPARRSTISGRPRCVELRPARARRRDRRHRRRVGQRPGGAGRGAGRPARRARRHASSSAASATARGRDEMRAQQGALPARRAAAQRLRRRDVGRREHRLPRASIARRSRRRARWSAGARCARTRAR